MGEDVLRGEPGAEDVGKELQVTGFQILALTSYNRVTLAVPLLLSDP